MSFDTLSPRLKLVAQAGLEYCKQRYGRNNLQIGQEIHHSISWKPTFYLKPTSSLILAVEVDEVLEPEVLKIAADDIRHYEFPVQVFVMCPLDIYVADTKQTTVSRLKRRGIGIITVDDDGTTTIQCQCVPLAQHISEDEVNNSIRGLTPNLKVNFRNAYDIYKVNEGQGLQEAGQIIEALINLMAKESERAGYGTGLQKTAAADTIDALYSLPKLKNHRAALGGARSFVKEYRNTASHAPTSAKKAIEKIRKCRKGFLDAIEIAQKLQEAMQRESFKIKIHIT